jgi:drug/metabolite transporter (DMT)-like permease
MRAARECALDRRSATTEVGDLAGSTLGATCALGSALTWTLIGLTVRALSPYFSSVAVNVIRSALGGIFTAVLVLTWSGTGPFATLEPHILAYLVASCLIAFGFGDSMFFESTKGIGLARALTISMIYPLFAAGLALVFLGERLTGRFLAGSVVTLAGIMIIVSERVPDGGDAHRQRSRGVGLALLAALAWAVGALLVKPALREIDPLTAQAVRLPIAAGILWLTPWARGTTRSLRAHGRTTGLLIGTLGVLTAASSGMFVAGIKYAGVGIATVLSSTAPLFALPIGLVALGEPLTWRAVAGAALAIAGIALLTL